MKLIKILSQVFFGLIFSIASCFAGDLISINPYSDVIIAIETNYNNKIPRRQEYNINSKYENTQLLIGDRKLIDFFDKHIVVNIKIALKNPETEIFHAIDRQSFPGYYIPKNMTYSKSFSIDDNHEGYIEYSIDLAFQEDDRSRLIESLNIEILQFIIYQKEDISKEIL